MNASICSKLRPGDSLDIFVDKKIGSGKFKVYHAIVPSQDTELVLKAFPDDEISQASFQREKDITANLNHLNIIKYAPDIHLQGLKDLKSEFLLMEYAPFGTFFDLVTQHGLRDERFTRTYFHQLIEGVEYLHSQKIAHMDLKLENLLLGEDFLLKIADFDQSLRLEEKTFGFRGTACYRAPEVLKGNCRNFAAADMFSIGVILYAFKAQAFPFIEKEEATGTRLIHYDLFTQDNEKFWTDKAGGKSDGFFSQALIELVNGLLEKDPNRRFTIDDVKRSKWYNESVFDKREMKTRMERLWERIIFKRSLKRASTIK